MTLNKFWSGIPAPDATSRIDEPPVDLNLPRWEESKAEFCARIAENRSFLKILLKTKNDRYFLETWIEHHANIVGLSNLIIFDNMSSSETVRRTYARYESHIPIIQFEGDHNRVHGPTNFPELYASLKRGCEYFAFLDTDEFLVLIDGQNYVCDETILDYLRTNDRLDVFPGTWLRNVVGSDRRFVIGDSLYHFGPPLAWGKPVVRSGKMVGSYINHNLLLNASSLSGELKTNFFELHLSRLFPQQRIEVNVNKLISKGLASSEDTVESILAKGAGGIDDAVERHTAERFIQEIKNLVERPWSGPARGALQKGCIELGSGGEVLCYGSAEAETLSTFLTDAQPFVHAVLQTDLAEFRTTSFARLTEIWRGRLGAWDYEGMIEAVKRIAAVQVPRNSRVAVVSKGDERLLDIPHCEVSHFPQDETGAYAGWHPADATHAVALVEMMCARGIEWLIIPRAAFWWLEHYHDWSHYLGSTGTEVWRSDQCVIYRLPAGAGLADRVGDDGN